MDSNQPRTGEENQPNSLLYSPQYRRQGFSENVVGVDGPAQAVIRVGGVYMCMYMVTVCMYSSEHGTEYVLYPGVMDANTQC